MKTNQPPTARIGLSLFGKAGLLAALALLAAQSANAASGTWDGTVDGTWANGSNWSATPAPATGDTATFANGGGLGGTTITIDSGRLIKSITFDPTLATLANYTIGSAGANAGNTLGFNANGAISIGAGAGVTGLTETFNAPLLFGGSYTFSNNQTGTGSNLVFAGNISNTATSTLTISGAGTGTGNLISGAISNGTGVQSVNIQATAGTWTLNGTNNYSGTTTIGTNLVPSTGIVILSGSNAGGGATTLNTGTLQLNNTTANNGGLASGVLTLAGGNIVVGSASALALSNAVSETNGGAISGAQSLTFNGDFTNTQSKTVTNSLTGGSTLTFAGKINLGGATGSAISFGLGGTGNTTFSGVMEDYSGGVGTAHSNITITNNGTTTISGLSNTYGGNTTMSATGGTLIMSGANTSAGNTTLTAGTLQLAGTTANNGGLASGKLSLIGTLQVASASSLSIVNAVDLANNTTVSGAQDFTIGGTLSSLQTQTLTNNITGGKTLTLSGPNVNIDTVTGTSTTLTLSGTGNTTISSAIQDYSGGVGGVGGNLTISNSGTTILSGTNTYTGVTSITSSGTVIMSGTNNSTGVTALNTTLGTLQLDNATNGGLASGLLTFTKGTLQSLVANAALSNAISLSAVTVSGSNNITFNGDLSEATNNTLTSSITGGNTLTLAGNVNIDQVTGTARTLTIAGAGNTTVSGGIRDYSGGVGTAHGALTITNNGTTTLSGNNTYGGKTSINAGTVQFAKEVSLYNNTPASWTAANITVASGATLALNVGGAGEFTASDLNTLLGITGISVASSSTTGQQAGSKLGFDTTGGTFTQGNAIANSTGTNGGAIGVVKLGTNSLVFDKANTYTGTTTVTLGTLLINGAQTNAGAFSVSSGGTLGGTGTVATASNAGMAFANGAALSPGDSSASNFALTLGTGVFDISAMATSSKLLFTLDTALASDKLTLTSGTLNIGTLNSSEFAFTLGGGFGVGTYSLFDTASTITSVSLDTATFALNGSFNGALQFANANQDIQLVVSAVPEPATWALLAFSLTTVMVLRRRRS